jgi:hypothetical protein
MSLSAHRQAYEKRFDRINHRGIFTFGAQGSIAIILDLREPPTHLTQIIHMRITNTHLRHEEQWNVIRTASFLCRIA